MDAPVGFKAHKGVGYHLIDQFGGIHIMDLPFFLSFFDDDRAEGGKGFSHVKAVPILIQIGDEELAEQVPSHGQGVGNEGGEHHVKLFNMGLGLDEKAGVVKDVVDGMIVNVQDQVFLGVYVIIKSGFCNVTGLTDIVNGHIVVAMLFK